MRSRRNIITTIGLIALVALISAAVIYLRSSNSNSQGGRVVRFGITPYQDTAIPVVGDRLGWYSDRNLNVQFVPLSWGDVMLGLSSGSIDVSIYTINAFQAPYAQAAKGSSEPIFYCPIYIFKGTALMVRRDAGLTPVGNISSLPAAIREDRVAKAVLQLKGKRIAVTEGTEYEQIVLAALEKADLDPKRDVTLIHASVEDSLAAFLSGNVDAFGAGLTERIEARRHGAIEFLVAADVGPPSIDGLVTTRKFAEENKDILDDLLATWFQTIEYMQVDLRGRSQFVREYLQGTASTRYSPDEYAIAWTFNVFPRNPEEAAKMFNSTEGPYYWRSVWDYNNTFLIQQGKMKHEVPYSAYWGEDTLSRLMEEK